MGILRLIQESCRSYQIENSLHGRIVGIVIERTHKISKPGNKRYTYDIKTECLEYHHCVASCLAYIPDSMGTLLRHRRLYDISLMHDQFRVQQPT